MDDVSANAGPRPPDPTRRPAVLVALCMVCAAVGEAQTPIDREFTASNGAFGFLTPPTIVPAFRGFDLRFRNHDNHVQELALARFDPTGFDVVMWDRGHDDAIQGSVHLIDVAGMGVERIARRDDCAAHCRIAVPWVSGGQAVVLTGFHFEYADRSADEHVREISVLAWVQNAYIEVYFGDNDGARRYRALVWYTTIPRSRLRAAEIEARSTAPVRGAVTVAREPGTAVLQMFRVRFTGSDHHLKRLAIDLTDGRLLVSLADNGNAPFEWYLRYATLR